MDQLHPWSTTVVRSHCCGCLPVSSPPRPSQAGGSRFFETGPIAETCCSGDMSEVDRGPVGWMGRIGDGGDFLICFTELTCRLEEL